MKLKTKLGQSIVVLLFVATSATTVSADWDEFWHGLHVGYARNNAWPDPFNEMDARSVIRPFEIMKQNGCELGKYAV